MDPAAAKLYMMNERGGIDRVSVTSGELLWSSTEAAKPLVLYGDLLVAQVESATANRLEIVLLDVLSGDRSMEFLIDLPARCLRRGRRRYGDVVGGSRDHPRR